MSVGLKAKLGLESANRKPNDFRVAETMKRFILALLAWIAGCSGGNNPSQRQGDSEPGVLSELESLPVGLEVVRSPARVGSPEGPNQEDWPYRWHFRTEVRAINRPLTITKFGILAWDGAKWILPPDQRHYNTGIGKQKDFVEWYHCPGGIVRPGRPAVDPENWAGANARKPFRQKWFFIGVDAQGKRYKGEGVVELLTDE